MTPSEQNQRVLGRLRASFSEFVGEEIDLDAFQSAVQAAISLLENDGTGVAEAVRLAEADIEEIRFTRLLGDQRSAVIFRLDELMSEPPDGGSQ